MSIGTIAAVNEDTNLLLQNYITVGDVDAASASLRIDMTVSSGVITVTTGTGISSITGSGTGSVVIVGTLSGLQTLFTTANRVTYRGNTNFTGTDTLVVTLNDQGKTGSGGAKTASASAPITVNAVNDAPTVSIGTIAAVNEDTNLSLQSAIIVGDIDAGSGNMVVTMTVSSGTINLTNVTGGVNPATADVVRNNGTATVVMTGTLTALQTTFAGTGALTYRGNLNFNGTDTLVVTINDRGNTGSGGHKTASASAPITVNAVNDAPTVSIGTIAAVNEDTNLALQNAIAVADIDAGGGNMVVTMTVSSGVITVTNVTGGINPAMAGSVRNNGTATVVMTGTLTALQTTFAGTGAAHLSRQPELHRHRHTHCHHQRPRQHGQRWTQDRHHQPEHPRQRCQRCAHGEH